MTDIISTPRAAPYQSDDFAARLRKRYAAERRFKLYGVAAIGIALGMLAVLLASIVSQGYTAFAQHDLALEIYFDPAEIDPAGHPRSGRPVGRQLRGTRPAVAPGGVPGSRKPDRAAAAELASSATAPASSCARW